MIGFLDERACIGHVRRFVAFTAALGTQMIGLMI